MYVCMCMYVCIMYVCKYNAHMGGLCVRIFGDCCVVQRLQMDGREIIRLPQCFLLNL